MHLILSKQHADQELNMYNWIFIEDLTCVLMSNKFYLKGILQECLCCIKLIQRDGRKNSLQTP